MSERAAHSDSLLSVRDIYRGRHVFVLGATGFLGKVLLSMLLRNFPDVGRVYVMVRRGSGTSSEARFWDHVVPSHTFDPLREHFGEVDRLHAFLRDKVRVVDGDITESNLGLSEEEAARVAGDIDVIINSSGKVTFNPPLESALRTNVQGTKNVIAFAKRMKRPALVHTSTCFVAGNRSGEIWENEPLDGYFPRWRELPATKFNVEQEIADCARIAVEVRAQADDAQVVSRLRQKARDFLRGANRDPDDEAALKMGLARERKDWIRTELTERGIQRAKEWGWPNIYTYTKSMGDQLVAQETGIVRSIVRPAIVESSIAYPFKGWNEGFTTSAPLVYLALKGQNKLPVSESLILDMVPVDHIAGGMLMVAAQACVEQPALVHQLASGDLNPSRIGRVTTLTGLYKRQRFQSKETGNKFLNELAARMEFRPVSYDEYDRTSLPLVSRMTERVSDALDKVRPGWGGGRFGNWIDQVKKKVDDLKRVTKDASRDIDLFRPFILDNAYVLRADNIRALRDRLPPEERALVPWSPETIDWYDYFMNIHFPGLQKWVLPELDETYAPKSKSVYAYRDLLELFDTTTKLHGTRVAMRMERGGRVESYSYRDLRELADRAGTFLVGEAVKPGDRVILFAKNSPEWAMSYFGILKAGATAVPVAHDSTSTEVVNIARASGAVGIMVGEDLLDKRSTLARELGEAGLLSKMWTFERVFELLDEAVENERKKSLVTKHAADSVASLIFTSGTTGHPKGVMLTHRNFTFMVAELSRIFELGTSDCMLSVLPLHHTFEFTAGLLVPLSHGTRITYIPDLTGDTINHALKHGKITAIVGVPALWETLRRRVLQRFSDKSELLESAVKALADANFELRARTGVDLGMFLFLPVHEKLGGRIRYMISGGSALPPDVLKTFYGMGFDFFEGYGLTETSPVLAVSTPKQKPIAGSVGHPLAGVEVKIDGPDSSGVGEVIARGKNVMAGYWQDEEATRHAIREGWFHTGDLGRFDEEGNLYIVGRSKDIIIDANGKNVYPDEIEELYKSSPYIKELSVVGLPDGVAEHVACAVVPDVQFEPALSLGEVKQRIEAHFRTVSSSLPFWKRVRTLDFWEGELPRTSTRKVKRRDVAAELRVRHEKSQAEKGVDGTSRNAEASHSWFLEIVADACGKPYSDVHMSSSLDELGFDSLTYNELAAGLEGAGVHVPEGVVFASAHDVASLLDMVTGKRHVTSPDKRDSSKAAESESDDIKLPAPVAKLGKRGLAKAQRLFYTRALKTKVRGEGYIPQHTNFIVAANHSSHLDMGALKVALGDAGHELASLAAADYFFKNKWRRAYFKNLTNLVPMERSGSIRKSLGIAEEVLRKGKSLVLFPEGTRSRTGEMVDFLPSLGYLSMHANAGILPAYIEGAHAAMPVGATVPKKRDLGVYFGPFLTIDFLHQLTQGMSHQESWRMCSAITQRIVENLRDGVTPRFDAESVRAAWNGEKLGPLVPPPFRMIKRQSPAPNASHRRSS
jgi:long-chain acyl-CoA synthetase